MIISSQKHFWGIHDVSMINFYKNGPLPVVNPQENPNKMGILGSFTPYLYHASFTPFITGFSGPTVSRVKLWNKGSPPGDFDRSASCTWQRAPSSKRSQASVTNTTPCQMEPRKKKNSGPLLSYLDLPRVSNFSPQVCFWWLRGSNFKPLGNSGNEILVGRWGFLHITENIIHLIMVVRMGYIMGYLAIHEGLIFMGSKCIV